MVVVQRQNTPNFFFNISGHSDKNQHGIHVKGQRPSMFKAAMKIDAGTSVELVSTV